MLLPWGLVEARWWWGRCLFQPRTKQQTKAAGSACCEDEKRGRSSGGGHHLSTWRRRWRRRRREIELDGGAAATTPDAARRSSPADGTAGGRRVGDIGRSSSDCPPPVNPVGRPGAAGPGKNDFRGKRGNRRLSDTTALGGGPACCRRSLSSSYLSVRNAAFLSWRVALPSGAAQETNKGTAKSTNAELRLALEREKERQFSPCYRRGALGRTARRLVPWWSPSERRSSSAAVRTYSKSCDTCRRRCSGRGDSQASLSQCPTEVHLSATENRSNVCESVYNVRAGVWCSATSAQTLSRSIRATGCDSSRVAFSSSVFLPTVHSTSRRRRAS